MLAHFIIIGLVGLVVLASASPIGKATIAPCTANSKHDPGCVCSYAYDGNLGVEWATKGEGVGSWL